MIKSLKKNQIIIFAVALTLIAAGYLNYSAQNKNTAIAWSEIDNTKVSGIGDARLVTSNNIVEQSVNTNEIVNNDNNTDDSSVETTSKVTEDTKKYFYESRLERERMYSEMLESYQIIISEDNVSADEKTNAQAEIRNINNQRNAIMIAENLIKNKGFEDTIVFVNKDSVSVVVMSDSIEEAEIAQIQSIIQRELNVNVENIHISNK